MCNVCECVCFNFADNDSEKWSRSESYVTVVVTVASLVCIFILLIACASLCPRRQGDGSRAKVLADSYLSFLYFLFSSSIILTISSYI